MTEDTHRTWDIVFKWLGLVGVLASAWWTVHSYRESRASELNQQRFLHEKDERDRASALEQQRYIHQKDDEARASELAQQKYNHQKDEEARTKDQNAFIFQRQAALYFEAARSAATLAIALDPPDAKAFVDAEALKLERERFEQLYWRELVVVEDRRIELAMIAFRRCLANNGENCERPKINQFGKNISPSMIKGDPIIGNLALDLAACVSSR